MDTFNLKNIYDKSLLEQNMIFLSFFITLYENTTSTIVDNLKYFFCDERVENNMCELEETDDYKQIKNRKIGGKKNILLSSVLWFVESGAITKAEYKEFLVIRDKRNEYAHEAIKILLQGIPEEDVKLFKSLRDINRKIDSWWVAEVEIPILAPKLSHSDNNEANGVSFGTMLSDAMLEILYREDDSKEH